MISVAVKKLLLKLGGKSDGLGRKMVTGTFWLTLGRFASQISSIARLAILARFLGPSDFGIMAIVLLVMNALDTFTAPGFIQALIQRQGEIDSYYPSVFTVNVLRSISLAMALVLIGPSTARFFGEPSAGIVIQFAAVIMIIRSLDSPAIANVHREMRFKAYFYWDISSTMSGLISAIVLAPFLRNVWVLLISLLVSELTGMLGSYVIAPWCPRLKIDWSHIRELHRFGRWVVLGTIVAFLSLQIDNIVVGRVLGASALGFYELAFRISQSPSIQVTSVAGTIAFPSLSSVASQPERFRSIYLRLVSALFAINLCILALIAGLAGPIVYHALGDKWAPIILPLRILAFAGCAQSFVTVGGRVFYALGHPRYDFYMNGLRIVVFIAIVLPLTKMWGLEGTSFAALTAIACVIPVYLFLIFRSIGIPPKDHLVYAFVSSRRAMARLAS